MISIAIRISIKSSVAIEQHRDEYDPEIFENCDCSPIHDMYGAALTPKHRNDIYKHKKLLLSFRSALMLYDLLAPPVP